MADLGCKVETCLYNKSECCCKGDIMVGGKSASSESDTCCESFSQGREESYTSALEHPSKTISIDCEADSCVHNSNYKCNANHVDIKGCSACDCRETQCGTFQAR